MHEGHRKRLRENFLKNGLDNFQSHNVLEMLLFYTIPRSDTNETAHRLIDRFGSLSAVLEAPVEELMKVKGVGERTATFLHLIPEITRVYLKDKQENVKNFRYSRKGCCISLAVLCWKDERKCCGTVSR